MCNIHIFPYAPVKVNPDPPSPTPGYSRGFVLSSTQKQTKAPPYGAILCVQ